MWHKSRIEKQDETPGVLKAVAFAGLRSCNCLRGVSNLVLSDPQSLISFQGLDSAFASAVEVGRLGFRSSSAGPA